MLRSLRLLLLEDDAEDAMLFQRRCPPGYRVHHVTTLDAALRAMREQEFDLCFADYRLGGQTGLDLLRTLRREGLRVPVVLITGQEIDALGENALLAGATDFVSKDDLYTRAIDKVCRRALIRRHADSQRDALAAPELVTALLGRAPLAARTSTSPQERRVLYVSRARRAFNAQELLLMCSRFAGANAALNVTGVLAHAGNRFLQVLEGQGEALDTLLARIQADPRHGELAVLLDEPAPARLFSQWAMGCLHAEARYDHASDASALAARLMRLLGPAGLTREGIANVLMSLPMLLGAAPAPQSAGISSSSFSGGTAG